jgi:hypothetical protein
MRFKLVPALASVALIFGASFAARAQQQQGQQQDQKVIDDFVTTRGVSFDEPSHAAPQRQTTHNSAAHKNSSGSVASKGHGANSSGSTVASNKNPSSTTDGTKKNGASTPKGSDVAAQSSDGIASDTGAHTVKTSASVGGGSLRPIGLGYTVFMKDKTGGLVAVNASQEYHAGDRIAIALEPNTEGYIYVFNASDDRDPMMLFPNVVLDGGANAAHAHVRETYPADVNYSFEFDNTPAVENVYVIVSRHPLNGVAIGDALAEFCGKKQQDCYWRPTAEQWQRIKAGATDHHVVEAKNTQIAQLQKPVQPGSLQRGIKIKRDDPAPAVVRVNDSPDADSLVTVIKLVHK